MSFVYFFVPAAARPLKVMRTTENLPKDWWFFFIHTRWVYSVNNPSWYFVSVGTCSTARHTHTRVVQYYYYFIILRCSWGEVTVTRGSHWSRPSRTRVLWMKPARFFYLWTVHEAPGLRYYFDICNNIIYGSEPLVFNSEREWAMNFYVCERWFK